MRDERSLKHEGVTDRRFIYVLFLSVSGKGESDTKAQHTVLVYGCKGEFRIWGWGALTRLGVQVVCLVLWV